VVWPFYFVRHGFLSISHSFLLRGFLSGASYEMEFTEGADMMPPGDSCVPLEVYFLFSALGIKHIKFSIKFISRMLKGGLENGMAQIHKN
jgi:hypothetical protein